jgi:hypothetical protein
MDHRMKKLAIIVAFALALASRSHAQTYNLFKPANGVLKGSTTTYVTSAAAASDIFGLFSGTCSSSTYLRGDGACASPPGVGTVTSVGMTVPSFLSVSGSPVTSSGTLAVTLSGTALPVANGGTGTTTSTGTGNTVLSTSPTLVTPALGTPASGVATNLTGTAAGLTAGAVTTNANLTGPITSTGNATAIAAQTGTGSTFVMEASPTLTTPNLGTPSALNLANATNLAFNNVAPGTNTGALVIGTGGSLAASGTGTIAATSLPTTGLTGTLAAAQFPALIGDVAVTAGTLTTAIQAGAVTLADHANLAANSIIGNNTGSPATPLALTTAQTKSLLAIANTDVSGLGTFATANSATPPAIGGTTPAAGAFSTLSASSTVSGTGFSTYLASPPGIGGTAAAAGAFTTLAASSTVSGTGFSTYLASPPAIGGTAAAAGSFTTLTSTTAAANLASNLTQASNTSLDGLTLIDSTAASAANQQYSPRIRLTGQGWKTTATAASQPVDVIMEVQPVQGTTNPASTFAISRQINGGGYLNVFSYNSSGTMTFGNATDIPGSNSFSATGTTSFNGNIIATQVRVSSATPNGNGMYLPATNTLGFSGGGTAMGSWSTTAFSALNGVLMPGLASSSAATTGTVCWTTSTGNLTVDTTTTCLLSDGRHKMNVEPLDAGIAEVMKLKPVSYDLKPEANPTHLGRQVGLIAQDVIKVDPRLAAVYQSGPDKDTPSGVRYEQMVALLVKGMQEQQHEIDGLRREITHMKGTK